MDDAAPPHCPHRPPCPGCPGLGRGFASLEVTRVLASFAQQLGGRFEVGASVAAQGYRHRARLAIRGRANAPKIGIFQSGSHRIADIPHCLVQHARINQVAQLVKQGIRTTGLAPYADVPHRGLLRYLQVVVEPRTQRVQLVLVTNDVTPESSRPLLDYLTGALGDQLDGLFWNGQPARGNAILGPHLVQIAGQPAMASEIAGARVFFPPTAFGQNNPVVYGHIVGQVTAWVPEGTGLLELYAGVGTLGLAALPRASRVRFNELAPGSLEGLSLGLAALPESARKRTEVLPGPAGEQLEAVARADTVIVDPPRKGLDGGLPEALASETGPHTLLYVSCGPKSFMRDAQALTASGRLHLRDLMVFDLFPWTGHVEVAARFSHD